MFVGHFAAPLPHKTHTLLYPLSSFSLSFFGQYSCLKFIKFQRAEGVAAEFSTSNLLLPVAHFIKCEFD